MTHTLIKIIRAVRINYFTIKTNTRSDIKAFIYPYTEIYNNYMETFNNAFIGMLKISVQSVETPNSTHGTLYKKMKFSA